MVEAEIEQNIANNKVMVYSKSSCPFCVRTKALLQEKGAEFKVVELDQLGNGAQIQAALQAKTGQRTVPNIHINGEFVGGNSELQALNGNGELDAKLAA